MVLDPCEIHQPSGPGEPERPYENPYSPNRSHSEPQLSATMSESMQLCLVSNDPTSTLLVTPDGIPMYSTETPSHSLLASGSDPASYSVPQPHQRSPTTTVKRLNRYNPSIGHAETVVGVVDYGRSPSGTSVQLCDEQVQLELTIAPSTARMIADRSENNDSDEEDGGLNMEK